MSVVRRPPSRKFTVAKVMCSLLVYCAATAIASHAQLTTLASFNGSNGATPMAGLVRGTDGNFYGTTYEGGTNSLGTVFKITPAGTLTSLHSFQGPFSDGAFPSDNLIQSTDGNFYGTTSVGGSIGLGTVFKITPGGTSTILHSFSGADGDAPLSELVRASDGNFYGTTSQVGPNGLGSVFKITSAGTLTTLTGFVQGGSRGSSPYGGLVQGSDGNLYGTTYAGGTSANCTGGCGVVFKITTGGTLTVLHNFTSADGARPQARLLKASDGNFYGTTFEGGANGAGTVFKITSGGTFTLLHSFVFNQSEGSQPAAGLIQATDGNLYGTTSNGGTRGFGTIFRITTAGTLTTLYSFQGMNDGGNPYGGVVQAPDGSFYGTTSAFGASGNGTVFKYVPPGTSTTTVSSTPNPSMSGELVTITATVGPAGPPLPTGTVGFTSNGVTIPGCGAVMLGSSRTAVCATSGLAVGTDAIVATYSGDGNYLPSYGTTSQIVNPIPMAVQFFPLPPCRVVDTRRPNGTFGGPILAGNSTRSFPLSEGDNPCQIPSGAVAYSLNVTVVPSHHLSYLTIWPTGQGQPVVSTLNSTDGRVKANAAIVPAGSPNGAVSVYVTDATHVILDIDGYFAPPAQSGLQFYPLMPCRVIDTRGGHDGGTLQHGQERDFPIPGKCSIPANAAAYSFNVTVVPAPGGLDYLTVWPAGGMRPTVSTLNDPTGTVVANAAIVPAGTGTVAFYPNDNNTDLIVDTNGYFGPPAQGGLSFYSLTPCRVYDSRSNNGQPFQGIKHINVVGSQCGPPATAQGYVFNATVVPQPRLGYLTLWPDPQQQPQASTLNAYDGFVTSNMAIVPNVNGTTDAFASDTTHLIMDISGYFAP